MAITSVSTTFLSLPVADEPWAQFRFRVLRDGEVTPDKKNLVFFDDFNSVSKVRIGFSTNDGEFTQFERVKLSTLQSNESWLVIGYDDTAPKRIRAAYLSIDTDGTYTFNITSGEGAAAGSSGAVDATVRVDGGSAEREVVIIERPSSGEWRVAGYGPASTGSSVAVKVTDGNCYAIALDDWGVQYQPNLEVTIGQTIRPTIYTGWLYRITEAGSLPATEPEWWTIDGDNAPRELGTARAVAVRYYRPLAHGPVPVEII